MLEAPEAREIELFRQAQDERDHGLNVAAFIVVDPQTAALGAFLKGQVKAVELRLVRLVIFLAKIDEEIDRPHGPFGRADIEEAREVREIIGHWALQIWRRPTCFAGRDGNCGMRGAVRISPAAARAPDPELPDGR